MLGLPPSVRIYFATALVDMRNGVDGLRTIVEQVLKRNPNEGHLFVFVGKRRDMLKILFLGQERVRRLFQTCSRSSCVATNVRRR
jgi:transposase